MSTVRAVQLDISSAEYTRDPHSTYRSLRATAAAHTISAEPDDWVLVTRYQLGRAVLADRRFSKRLPDRYIAGSSGGGRGRSMLGSDPPEHTRLRNAVARTFHAHNLARMIPRMAAVSRELIAGMRARLDGPDGVAELRHDYALPFAFTVLAELIGIPVAMQHDFHKWTTVMLSPVTPDCDEETHTRAVSAIREYVSGRVTELKRSSTPNGGWSDALIPTLALDDSPDALTEDEIITMITLVLAAGYEGAANMILNGMVAFLTNLPQWELLVGSPELAGAAVREVLRYDCPVQRATLRVATEDVELEGVRFPKGTLVGVSLTAGNRDERRFPDADRFDLTRAPAPHLAFGHGLHHCLGANLAAQEGATAFAQLAELLPDLRLAPTTEAVVWARTGFLRGPARLHVVRAAR